MCFIGVDYVIEFLRDMIEVFLFLGCFCNYVYFLFLKKKELDKYEM